MALRAIAGQVFQPARAATATADPAAAESAPARADSVPAEAEPVPAEPVPAGAERNAAERSPTPQGTRIAAMDVAANTLIQRSVPARMLGRVFGSLYGAIGVAVALSYLGGGLLLDLTDPRTALVAAGAGGLIATAATALALRRSG
ncbi:hypothetical protein [Nocardia sp. NPDC127526]|uniref:hypothetical protein n=1 Tax=Nocardia sp. NPDC127526 TaxID=3345393 RepID=UPI00362B88C2